VAVKFLQMAGGSKAMDERALLQAAGGLNLLPDNTDDDDCERCRNGKPCMVHASGKIR